MIPDSYQLAETHPGPTPFARNRMSSTATPTLIVHRGSITGGTRFTLQMAKKHGRPHLCIDLADPMPVDELAEWMADWSVDVLNVAGPRESTSRRHSRRGLSYLREVFTEFQSRG